MFVLNFIIGLFWILLIPVLAFLIIGIYCACVLSSNLSRQEEWEEMQRKLKDCNKQ